MQQYWRQIVFVRLLHFKAAAFLFSAPFGLALILLATIPSVVTAQTASQTVKSDPSPLGPNDPIVFLGATGYPPYGFIENSKAVGANVDLIKAIGKVLGRPVGLRLYNWADAQVRFNNGEGHALVVGVITAERQKLYDFTQSTFKFEFMLFSNSERLEDFANLNLSNKRIAVTRGSYPQTILENHYPEAEIVLVDDMADGFQLLSKGEVDAALEENLVGQDQLKRADILGIAMIETPLSTNTAHIPVLKGNSALLKELNQAISILKSSGKIREISQKWLENGAIFITHSEKNAAIIGAVTTLTIFAILTIFLFLITKKSIKKRKQSEQALRESENRYAHAVSMAQAGTWELDLTTKQVTWSDQVYRIFDIPLGTPITYETVINRVHPDDRDYHYKKTQLWRENPGEPPSEYRIVISDGSIRFIYALGELTYDDEGKQAFLRGFVQDITYRKQLEEQLRQSQRMGAVGQLTGGVAHDFNNLMAIMMGNLEAAMDKAKTDDQLRSNIEMALNAVDRGAALTQQLLSFSRQQILSPAVADIKLLVEGTLTFLKRTLGENIRIVTEHVGEETSINVDAAIFGNSLVNLAINARDAMPDGGSLTVRTATVELAGETFGLEAEPVYGAYAMITITDTGSGIDQQDLSQVMEPFFTTKEVGEGSGLGLSMVYGFAIQSNGYMDITSSKGVGTAVSLYFPITDGKTVEEDEEIALSPKEHINKTILLVEDDQPLREITSATLKELGYTVIEAADGPSALEILHQTSGDIDLVFTDVIMPNNMSGVELAKQIAVHHKHIKVLLTSGYPDKIADNDDIKAMGIELLAKPFRKAKLAAAIKKAVTN